MLIKTTLVFIVTVLACGSGAFADIPVPYNCTISMPNIGDSSPALFCLPNGEGNEFFNAQSIDNGDYVDATIELIVRDSYGDPVPGIPREDMWLGFFEGGIVSCSGGGTNPDGPTDINGVTYWSNPIRIGGSGAGYFFVNVYDLFVPEPPLSLWINSADMNGDGTVNLADVGNFSGAFFGTYDFAADFFADGLLNLADVGRLAQGIGTSCP